MGILGGYKYRARPCKMQDEHNVTVCEDMEAEFYGVYRVMDNGMEEHIVDIMDKEEARRAASLLQAVALLESIKDERA